MSFEFLIVHRFRALLLRSLIFWVNSLVKRYVSLYWWSMILVFLICTTLLVVFMFIICLFFIMVNRITLELVYHYSFCSLFCLNPDSIICNSFPFNRRCLSISNFPLLVILISSFYYLLLSVVVALFCIESFLFFVL